jgi:gamma-glutamyltranspeptidase/glutathione hydrolase
MLKLFREKEGYAMRRRLNKKGAVMRFIVAVSVFSMLSVFTASQHTFAIETFTATNYIAASGHQQGAAAAFRILEQGGNAVDAMVAMYAAISLAKADMAGPFGGGWALIYIAKTGKTVALDMDSIAPAAASAEGLREAFREKGLTGPRIPAGPMARGPLAVGVGGNLKGWEAMLDRYGTMTFSEVLKPAIEMAEKGFSVDKSSVHHIKRYIPTLSIYPTWVDTFTIDGKAPKPGQKVYNKNLANTFKKVAALGADVVYKGEIADEIARYFKEIGGWITKEDLANYDVVWSEPYKSTYTSWRLLVFWTVTTSRRWVTTRWSISTRSSKLQSLPIWTITDMWAIRPS